jgi:hypothetical protein
VRLHRGLTPPERDIAVLMRSTAGLRVPAAAGLVVVDYPHCAGGGRRCRPQAPTGSPTPAGYDLMGQPVEDAIAADQRK